MGVILEASVPERGPRPTFVKIVVPLGAIDSPRYGILHIAAD